MTDPAGYGFGSAIWFPIQTQFINPGNLNSTNETNSCGEGARTKYFIQEEVLKQAKSYNGKIQFKRDFASSVFTTLVSGADSFRCAWYCLCKHWLCSKRCDGYAGWKKLSNYKFRESQQLYKLKWRSPKRSSTEKMVLSGRKKDINYCHKHYKSPLTAVDRLLQYFTYCRHYWDTIQGLRQLVYQRWPFLPQRCDISKSSQWFRSAGLGRRLWQVWLQEMLLCDCGGGGCLNGSASRLTLPRWD